MDNEVDRGLRPPMPHHFTFVTMMNARRWLIASSDKVPHYANGSKRHGTLDSPSDWAQLVSYQDARNARDACGVGWLLGFALGPDGTGCYWQGIDLDNIVANSLHDIANRWARGDCLKLGYMETSPSGNGIHIIGYGGAFATLGANRSGIEAYANGRYFTVTENALRADGMLTDLKGYVEQELVPRHGFARSMPTNGEVEVVQVDPKTVSALRSALAHMRSDDRDLWVRMGMALRELGEIGRGLWLYWSQASDKYNAKEASRVWASLQPTGTGWAAVLAEAQRQGWVNPASSAAQTASHAGAPSTTGARELKGRSLGDVTMRAIEWLWTGWIPKGYITIFAGETGAGKSTVLADIAARVTTGDPWPGIIGIPGEKRDPARVLWLGSEDGIEEMTIPRLTACGANLHNVIEIVGVMHQGKRDTFSMQDDLEAVGIWIEHARSEGLPFAMLVIDPVTSYLPGQKLRRVDLNDAGQLRTILEPWLILAQKHGIAVVCVTHFAKDTSRSMLHRVLGSAAFAQTCRSLIGVIEPPTTEDYEPGPFEKAMLQVKVNLPEHPGGAWRFSTERVEVGMDHRNGKTIFATRPNWEELDTALTPKTAVGSSRGPKSKGDLPFAIWIKASFAVQAAEAWLQIDGHQGVKATAMRDGACPSESWWNKHSGDYLDKQNVNGTWWCRPKQVAL